MVLRVGESLRGIYSKLEFREICESNNRTGILLVNHYVLMESLLEWETELTSLVTRN